MDLPEYHQFSIAQSRFVVPVASVLGQYGGLCAVGAVSANGENEN